MLKLHNSMLDSSAIICAIYTVAAAFLCCFEENQAKNV